MQKVKKKKRVHGGLRGKETRIKVCGQFRYFKMCKEKKVVKIRGCSYEKKGQKNYFTLLKYGLNGLSKLHMYFRFGQQRRLWTWELGESIYLFDDIDNPK